MATRESCCISRPSFGSRDARCPALRVPRLGCLRGASHRCPAGRLPRRLLTCRVNRPGGLSRCRTCSQLPGPWWAGLPAQIGPVTLWTEGLAGIKARHGSNACISLPQVTHGLYRIIDNDDAKADARAGTGEKAAPRSGKGPEKEVPDLSYLLHSALKLEKDLRLQDHSKSHIRANPWSSTCL